MPFHKIKKLIRGRICASKNINDAMVNTCWLSAEKVFRMALGLTVGAWMARYLGPDKFGTYNFIIAMFTLFFGFSRMGLDNIVIRDLVKGKKDKNALLGSALLLKLLSGLGAMGLLLAAISYLRPDDKEIFLMACLISVGFIFQSFSVIEFWFASQVRSKYVAIAKIAALLVYALTTVVLIVAKASLLAFVFVYLLEIVMTYLGIVCFYSLKEQSITKWKANLSTVKELLFESWPLLLSAIAVTVYIKIDAIMLAEMIGDVETGIYSAATRISEAWYFIPVAITSSVSPMLMKSKEKGEEIYLKRLGMLFNLLSALTIFVAIIVTLFSAGIISILFGEEYARSASVLSVHVWAGVFVALGVSQSVWLINEGYTKFAMARTVAGMVSNIILNIFMIPVYGAIGAAVATVISYIISGVVANFFYNKHTRKIMILQIKSLSLLGLKNIKEVMHD
jgi:PST family polysaccharide transporter